jgi:hypothetical protein
MADPRSALAGGSFVGRAAEVDQLMSGLADVLAGRGRLFLVTGEAGIGKTRLADELAARAAAAGARVLWGRCWEGGGAPAYWPWVQVLRAYVRDTPADVLSRHIAAGAADIAPMHADVAAQLRITPAGTGIDTEQARFNLFDSTATLLRNAAAERPLALILDDLHAADESSLLLLQFLAADLRTTPLLVLGTYRDAEVRRSPARLQILGALVREAQRLPLAGLSHADLGRYVESAAAFTLTDAALAAVHQATNGNPFFVSEIVRLWVSSGAREHPEKLIDTDLQLPDEVRAAIRRHFEPLSAPAREALSIAAVIGREFDLAVFERVAAPLGAPRELLAEAVSGGLVGSVGVGRYSFAHALVRQTLYGDLAPSQRIRLHRDVADALEAHYRTDPEPHLADLAHHFFQAAPAGGAERAVLYARRAGDQALRQLAFAEAAAHYEHGLHALDVQRDQVADQNAEALLRGELLIAFGRAQRRSGGPGWRSPFRRAAGIARSLLGGSLHAAAVRLLGEAALGFGRGSETGSIDAPLIALLEEALACVGDLDASLRAQLLARLAMALYFSAPARCDALSAEAVALAEGIAAPTVLLSCLIARHFALWRPETLAERTAIATRIVSVGEAAGERDLVLEGRLWRIVDHFEAAAAGPAARESEMFARAAAALRHPLYQWHALVHRGMRALADGRLADAEALANEAREFGQHCGLDNPLQAFGIQMYAVRREQGRLGEIAVQVQALAEGIPLPIWRCAAALLAAETARSVEAQRELEALSSEDFAALPIDGNWLPALAVLAETCVALGDRQRGASVYQRLAPYDGRVIVIAQAVALSGPVAYFLGLLAAQDERWDAALVHLTDALETARQLDAAMLVAQCACGLAAALAAGAPDRPHGRAAELAAEALATAHARGLVRIAAQAQQILDRLPRGDSAPAAPPAPPAPATGALFRKEGQYWTIAFDGIDARLKDGRGLAYIAHLLRHPGRELHTLDLATSMRSGPAPPTAAALAAAAEGDLHVGGDDAGAVLDPAAKAAYRGRLVDLREELEEATAFNDPGRAERAQAEIEAITHELSAAVGLGNRDRKTGSQAERSRVAVTKAILLALKAIATANPSLHRYLAGTIKTGQFCSYTPDPRFDVTWNLD